MAESADSELADSCGQFRGISQNAKESAGIPYSMYIKD